MHSNCGAYELLFWDLDTLKVTIQIYNIIINLFKKQSTHFYLELKF